MNISFDIQSFHRPSKSAQELCHSFLLVDMEFFIKPKGLCEINNEDVRLIPYGALAPLWQLNDVEYVK